MGSLGEHARELSRQWQHQYAAILIHAQLLWLGRSFGLRLVEHHRGMRLRLATLRRKSGMDAIPGRAMDDVSGPRLDVGQLRTLGLDAVSLRRMDRLRRSGLVMDAWRGRLLECWKRSVVRQRWQPGLETSSPEPPSRESSPPGGNAGGGGHEEFDERGPLRSENVFESGKLVPRVFGAAACERQNAGCWEFLSGSRLRHWRRRTSFGIHGWQPECAPGRVG